MPASGSSSSIGASDPFATTAPDSQSERNAYAPSVLSGQKRSARSRSLGACENCTEAATPSCANRGRSSGARHCACSIRGRRPSRRPLVARRLERVERVAVRAVADRVHRDRPADARSAPHDLLELLAARDLDARAVEHARGLRAERPVHERLQVAGAQPVVAEPRAEVERLERVEVLVRQRLPHAQVEDALVAQALEQAKVAEPAVLVVHRRHAARDRELDAGAHRVEPLVLADLREHEAPPELPRRLLAQHARRLAAVVELDDAAGNLQVAVGRARAPPS